MNTLAGNDPLTQILTKSFVRTLLDMSKMEHRDTQQRVVIAVYRISCYKRGRELLLEEGAPELLIRLISKPNEEMRKVRLGLLLLLRPLGNQSVTGCDEFWYGVPDGTNNGFHNSPSTPRHGTAPHRTAPHRTAPYQWSSFVFFSFCLTAIILKA